MRATDNRFRPARLARALIRRVPLGGDFLRAWDEARGRRFSGRDLEVLENDTFIVSYPRSGNTWTRFLVANLLYGQEEPTTFANLEDRVPAIYGHTRNELLALERPRVLKSHEYFDPRYQKVLFVVRDPRDIAVSYYHYLHKRGRLEEGETLTDFMPRFLGGRIDGFGSWGDHTASWLATRGTSRAFKLVRYEDLLSDGFASVAAIAEFLGVEVSDEQLGAALRASSFEEMQAQEQATGDAWTPIRKSRKDVQFVRSGKTGTGLRELPASAVVELEAKWAGPMTELGY